MYLTDAGDFRGVPTSVNKPSELLPYLDAGGSLNKGGAHSVEFNGQDGPPRYTFCSGNFKTINVLHSNFTANGLFMDGHSSSMSEDLFSANISRGDRDCIWDDE